MRKILPLNALEKKLGLVRARAVGFGNLLDVIRPGWLSAKRGGERPNHSVSAS